MFCHSGDEEERFRAFICFLWNALRFCPFAIYLLNFLFFESKSLPSNIHFNFDLWLYLDLIPYSTNMPTKAAASPVKPGTDKDNFLAACIRHAVEKPKVNIKTLATELGMSEGGAR